MTRDEWLRSEDPAAMLRFLTDRPMQAASGHKKNPRRPSGRRLRLFACACCRMVWDKLTDDAECDRCKKKGAWTPGPIPCPDCNGTGRINRSRKAVEVAEKYADGIAPEDGITGEDELALAHMQANRYVEEVNAGYHTLPWLGFFVTDNRPEYAANSQMEVLALTREAGVSKSTQADLLRCVAGDPFEPVKLWNIILNGVKQGSDQGNDLDDSCVTPQVLSLAQAAYEERGPRKCDECVDGDVGCHHCEGAGIYYEPPYSLNRLKCPHCNDGLLPDKCRKCDGTGNLTDGSLDPARLAVLSDALEEAGCGEQRVLSALHGTGPFYRGFWVLDLLLGKE